MKVLLLGHVTLDLFDTVQKNGGPPNYQAPVFKANGVEVTVVTSCDSTYPLQFEECQVGVVHSKESTTFKFEFGKNDQLEHTRSMRIIKRASDLNYPDIKKFLDPFYDAIIVSPVAQEVDVKTLSSLRRHTELLAVDIQGYSRSWDSTGYVSENITQETFDLIMENADLVKASHNEIQPEIIHQTLTMDTSLLVTRSGADVFLYHRGEKRVYQTQRVQEIVDDTGAGDIFLAAYLVGKFFLNDDEAMVYANETAKRSLKIKGIPSVHQIIPIKV
jgi:hypothetical protein